MNVNEALALLKSSGCSQDVVEHCKAVSDFAYEIAEKIQNNAENKGQSIQIDIQLVIIGGLLHDIGRARTHGIRHAVEGARIAIEKGIDDRVVRIIERHIGAGIPKEEALRLGLPEKDFVPETMEEKIVAHADNLVFGGKRGTMDELLAHLRRKKLDHIVIQRIIELNDEISAMMV